jgi:hypothetical protein
MLKKFSPYFPEANYKSWKGLLDTFHINFVDLARLARVHLEKLCSWWHAMQ